MNGSGQCPGPPEDGAHKFFKAATRFGMLADAADGWSQIHVQPHHVCAMGMSAGVLGTTAFAFLHIFGSPWLTMKIHIPAVTMFALYEVYVAGVWRYGPHFTQTHAGQLVIGVATICSMYLFLLSFVGPLTFTPFQSRVASTIGSAIGVFLLCVFSACGGMAAEHPSEPHISLSTPVMTAAFSSLRLIDSGTDMGLVRVLWDQVSSPVKYHTQLPCLPECLQPAAHKCCGHIQGSWCQ